MHHSTITHIDSRLYPKALLSSDNFQKINYFYCTVLALRLGFISLHPTIVYWLLAVLIIVITMFIQGLGILLPRNLRIYFELRNDKPDMTKIQKFMKLYVKVVATQTVLQFFIIFIMANFATGFPLRL